ncbi:MAG: signal peptidase II [Saccharofermentans sp.]|nr:signal peptidase II [Saccharofermentans sp.]
MNEEHNGRQYVLTFSFLMLILVIADQFTKRIITFKLDLLEQKVLIKDFLSFYYCTNTGSAFSFLADKTWGIYVLSAISLIVGLIIVYVMVFAARRKMLLISTSLCLIAAGAFGNLVDRFTLKYVIDFIRFDFGSWTFPIFNFADICAVIGTIMFVLIVLFGKDRFDLFWQELTDLLRRSKNA